MGINDPLSIQSTVLHVYMHGGGGGGGGGGEGLL